MDQQHPLFESLRNDLRYYADYLNGLAREILDSGTSKYPVFVAHQEKTIGIGKAIMNHDQLETNWSINVSLLEEFVKRGLVTREKLPEFKASWKDPESYMCVFVLAGEASSFVFLPYEMPEESSDID
jgi:hypothetical protein